MSLPKKDPHADDPKVGWSKAKLLINNNYSTKHNSSDDCGDSTPEISLFLAETALASSSKSLTLDNSEANKLSSSTSSLATSSPPSVSPSSSPGLFQSLLGLGLLPRQRTVSEGQVSRVSVDLGAWLQEGHNARDLRVARVRRNSSRAAEEAMSSGLTKADIHMPPV